MRRLFQVLGGLLLVAVIAGAVFYFDPLWVNDQQIRWHLWRSNVRSEYVQAGSYRLHYFEALPSDGSAGTPLVLVHGLGARGEDWSSLIPSLAAAGFHVYAPDLLGYGRSDKPDVQYSVALEEGVVVSFLDKMGLTRFDLIGWSMGGWIAAMLTLDHPAVVDRLVLYDSAGITFQPSFARTAFVPTDQASLDRLIALLTPTPRTLPSFVVRATLRRSKERGEIVQQSLDSMESGADILDHRLQGLKQPTLLVWGAEDRLIPPSVGEEMHRLIPGSRFETIPGCGHLAPAECPLPVLAETLPFLGH